jgi:tRNA threonylcarbamoyladenosine biosynthesis protein TsaB
MLLLALDTSTRLSSIALCREDELLGEYTWHAGTNHSVELLENIRRLMIECQLSLPQIEAVAVATGPGSFNGVRVALAAAKALAFSLKKTLVGVSTLEVIAAQQPWWPGPVCAVLEAGRSELYAACYRFQGEPQGDEPFHIERVSEYLLFSPEQLVAHIREQANLWGVNTDDEQKGYWLFCGELKELSSQVLHEQMQGRCRVVRGIQASRHASTLSVLALQRLREGKLDDPLLLEPLYLRRPSITKSARKQSLLGGMSAQETTDHPQTERGEGALRH